MPWQSRIENPLTRRVVLAGLLLAVLGASTGLAAWMTVSRRPPVAPGEPTHRFGRFEIAVSSTWQMQRRDTEAEAPRWAEFVERGRTGRSLQIIVIEDERPTAPLAAMQQAKRRLSPSAGWINPSVEQVGAQTLLIDAGQSVGAAGNRRVAQTHALAVATADGRTYLAIHLRGFGRVSRQDMLALRQIAATAHDTRYTLIEDDHMTLGPLRLLRPRGLTASRIAGRPDAVQVGPERPGRFYRLQLQHLNLSRIDQAPTGVGVDAAEPPTAEQLAQRALATRYRALNDQPLPAERYRRATVEGRAAHMAVLADARSTGVQHEAWVVPIDQDAALQIDLLADRSAINLVRYAAQVMLSGLDVTHKGADS